MLSFQCLVGRKSVDIQRALYSFCFQSLQSHLWIDKIYIAEIISIRKKFAQQFAGTYHNANIYTSFASHVYLNKNETNNSDKFGQHSPNNYQIWQCYIHIYKSYKKWCSENWNLYTFTYSCLIYFLTKVFKRQWNITNSK